MGAINYKTSKFLTIGYNLHDMECDEFYFDYIEDEFDNINILLKQQDFKIFTVDLVPGYYEGFSINIDFDYLYFDDYNEKLEALKEITQLKQFLIFCVKNFNVNVCHPGWCTSYLNYKDSLTTINNKIKEIKQLIKSIPTYKRMVMN